MGSPAGPVSKTQEAQESAARQRARKDVDTPAPASEAPAALRRLQSTLGNQAVAGLAARSRGGAGASAQGPIAKMSKVDQDGTTTTRIDGIPVLHFRSADGAQVEQVYTITPGDGQPDTLYIGVRSNAEAGAVLDQEGLAQLQQRFKVVVHASTGRPVRDLADGGITLPDATFGPRLASRAARPVAATTTRKPVPSTAAQPQAQPQTHPEPAAANPVATTPAATTTPAAPIDLSDRVATIRKNLARWNFNLTWESDIVGAFKGLSAADFVRLQGELSEDEMKAVFDMPGLYASEIGTLGPVVKGRDQLNRKRIDFIENIRDWGSAKESFYSWIIDSASVEDLHAVVEGLRKDQRLRETLLDAPGVAQALQARGIAPSELKEEEIGVLTGIRRGLGHVWDAAWSQTAFAGGGNGLEQMHLPQKYRDRNYAEQMQDFEKAMTPANVARGALSNVTGGLSDLPFGLYDASKLTVQAAQDLWDGHPGAASEKLTPIVTMILIALVAHRVGKSGAGGGAALEDSKALAPLEGSAVVERNPVPAGPGASGWDVRNVGSVAEGVDRYIGRHAASGELVEFVVDRKTGSVRATRLATGEVIRVEEGQIKRGAAPQLAAGEPAVVPPAAQQLTAGEPAVVAPAAQAGGPVTPTLATTAEATATPGPRALPAATTAEATATPGPRALPAATTAEATVTPGPRSLPAPVTPRAALPSATIAESAQPHAGSAIPATAAAATQPEVIPGPRPRTESAAARVAEARQALATARAHAEQARQALASARADAAAAKELAAEQAKPGKAARELVREQQANLRKAEASAASLSASEHVAMLEEVAASQAEAKISALETRLLEVERDLQAELHPPGGFSREARAEGRSGGILPSRNQKSAARYFALEAERSRARAQLADWVAALRRSLRAQSAKAVPGNEGKALASLNAQTLPDALKPVGGRPVDITTGLPILHDDWVADHIVARSRISKDPRFARLSPIQRDAILHEIPENFLPITAEANSSKGGKSVESWIAARRRSGQPLPAEVVRALRVADARAHAAIEAFFTANLPP